MGLRSIFSCNEPFQDQVSQFHVPLSALGLGARLRLCSLTQDGEPHAEVFSCLHLLTLWSPSSTDVTFHASSASLAQRGWPVEAVSSGEEQLKGVRRHSLAATTPRLGVKIGWLERALRQAGQG